MTDTITLPAPPELAHRVRRMAHIVVMAVDHDSSNMDAASTVAMWEIITGVEDAAAAIAHARRIAAAS